MCGESQPQTATPGEALWEHACNVWQIFLKHLRGDLKHSQCVGSSFGTGYFSQTGSIRKFRSYSCDLAQKNLLIWKAWLTSYLRVPAWHLPYNSDYDSCKDSNTYYDSNNYSNKCNCFQTTYEKKLGMLTGFSWRPFITEARDRTDTFLLHPSPSCRFPCFFWTLGRFGKFSSYYYFFFSFFLQHLC